MNDLDGKVALVTGGSRGMGASIARHLAAQGADVAITYVRAADKGSAVVNAIHAHGRRGLAMRADNAQPQETVEAVHQAAKTFGRLDILVNNAGIFPFGPPEDVSADELDRALSIHARAVFLASQAALRHMGDGGSIISIGSSLIWRVTSAGMTLYAMSKSALIGFTKGLARDVAPRGITVNLINPGSIDTDMNPADGEFADTERVLIPLGRYGRPDDVATMAAYLAGPNGRYITGASIAVDGGVTV